MSRAATATATTVAAAVTKNLQQHHLRGMTTTSSSPAAASSASSPYCSSFKLLGAAWTRAFRCIWMLEELGIPYQILDQHYSPGSESVKKFNVSGKVPVLLEFNNSNNTSNNEEPSFILTESTAINTYLGDCFPASGLVPSSATNNVQDRARYNATISFISNELDSQALWAYRKHVSMGTHFGHLPEMERIARSHFEACNAVVAQQLLLSSSTTSSSSLTDDSIDCCSSSSSSTGPPYGHSYYLLGPHFTAADILYVHCLDWAKGLQWHGTWPPHLHAYRQRCHERPAYQRTKALRDAMGQKKKNLDKKDIATSASRL
jgi:glutathione S-transferase